MRRTGPSWRTRRASEQHHRRDSSLAEVGPSPRRLYCAQSGRLWTDRGPGRGVPPTKPSPPSSNNCTGRVRAPTPRSARGRLPIPARRPRAEQRGRRRRCRHATAANVARQAHSAVGDRSTTHSAHNRLEPVNGSFQEGSDAVITPVGSRRTDLSSMAPYASVPSAFVRGRAAPPLVPSDPAAAAFFQATAA